MLSFYISTSMKPNFKGKEETIGQGHQRGFSHALLYIPLSPLSGTCWAGTLCKYFLAHRPEWVSRYALPVLLGCILHTCYSFIHYNDWVSMVAKNMDFGVRLPRFKFHLLHLLPVWSWASYLIFLYLGFLICNLKLTVLPASTRQ